MSDMQEHLRSQLEATLKPSHLEVINESNQHSGADDSSHFKLIVVSDYFNDLKLIDRHRFINNLFKEELNYIHALAMHTYTAPEWSSRQEAPDSPKCAGGSKN